MYCFGVDIGGTTVKMGVFSEEGTLLDKWEIPTRRENGGKAILPDVAQAILDKMKEKTIAKEQVLGVGVTVPAPVVGNGIVKQTTNLGWGYTEVDRELGELTGLRIQAANDANAAALGEMWKGGGEGYQNLVMVTLGTGVGGGIIINGKMLTGANGAGGEIGHIVMEPDEVERCGCGKTGCLEQYASATGIARLARRELAETNEDTVLNAETVTAKDVFDAVKVGDPVAIAIAKKFGRYLGHGLASVAALVDPEAIVIGGGVSKAGEILFDFIQGPYMEKAFYSNKEVDFVLEKLGNDAGIYGAAKMVLED